MFDRCPSWTTWDCPENVIVTGFGVQMMKSRYPALNGSLDYALPRTKLIAKYNLVSIPCKVYLLRMITFRMVLPLSPRVLLAAPIHPKVHVQSSRPLVLLGYILLEDWKSR